MNKPNQTKHVDTENRAVVTRKEGESKMGKGDPPYADGWKLNFYGEQTAVHTEVKIQCFKIS